jgi:hypothetical protein
MTRYEVTNLSQRWVKTKAARATAGMTKWEAASVVVA